MRKDLENLLYGEVEDELGEIANMKLGSDEYTKTTNAVNGMIDRLHESKKIENETLRLEIEKDKIEIEKEKNHNDNTNNVVKNIITATTFVLSAGVAVWANIDSKRFEKGFTHTTEAGRASNRIILNILDKFK